MPPHTAKSTVPGNVSKNNAGLTGSLNGITPSDNGSRTNRRELGTQKTAEEIREEPGQDVRNVGSAKKFLLEHQLVPPDVPLTLELMSNVLMSLTQAKGVSGNKTTQAVLRSVAYVLDHVTHDIRTDKIMEVIDKRLDERMEVIQSQLIAGVDVIVDAMKVVVVNAAESMEEVTHAVTGATEKMEGITKSYKQALTQAVPLTPNPTQIPFAKATAIDPRLRAREGIRQRQILIDLGDGDTSELKVCSMVKLVESANSAIKRLDEATTHRVVGASRLQNGGILLEADSADAAAWIRDPGRTGAFVAALDPGAKMRSRLFPTIAQFVPISFGPENQSEIEEVEDNNKMARGSIGVARWIKPVNRRQTHQSMAHLAIRYTSPEAANYALLNGIFICGTRVMSIKGKREPLRCLSCHGWDHLAASCTRGDKCGTCAGAHRTATCNSRTYHCTPCDSAGHASWSRECPTFREKCAQMDKRLPENGMPYYPTDEVWTQAAAPVSPPPFGQTNMEDVAPSAGAWKITRSNRRARGGSPGSGANTQTSSPDAPARYPLRAQAPSSTSWSSDFDTPDADTNSPSIYV